MRMSYMTYTLFVLHFISIRVLGECTWPLTGSALWGGSGMVAERNLMEDERAVITSTDSAQYREKSKNWDT